MEWAESADYHLAYLVTLAAEVDAGGGLTHHAYTGDGVVFSVSINVCVKDYILDTGNHLI